MNDKISDPSFRLHNQFKNEDSLAASHFALKLALQQMKERCQKLQKRLTCLEDENLQLRIERHSVPALVKKEPKSDNFALQKQVEELKRQKSLLCHHIYMVATENKDLWDRLSRATDDKAMLDIDLQALVENNSNPLPKPEKSLNIVDVCQNLGDKEDFMEEISLKVLASLKKSKPSTEDNQGNSNRDGEIIKECEYTVEMEEEGLYEGLLVEVSRVLEKLKNEKLLLKQQQEGLKETFDIITQYLKKEKSCNNCTTLQEELEKERSSRKSNISLNNGIGDDPITSSLPPEPNFNISRGKETTFEDRICPLCTKFYPKSTPFDEFNEHVLSHFVEEPEQDSLMSNFDLIT